MTAMLTERTTTSTGTLSTIHEGDQIGANCHKPSILRLQRRAFTAGTYLEKQFGTDPRWSTLSRLIAETMSSAEGRSFPLSSVDAVAEAAHFGADEVEGLQQLLGRYTTGRETRGLRCYLANDERHKYERQN